jgi:hypothetical protein
VVFLRLSQSSRSGQDFGLLLSAIGWALVAVALLIQYSAARAMAALVASGSAEGGTAPGARICGFWRRCACWPARFCRAQLE